MTAYHFSIFIENHSKSILERIVFIKTFLYSEKFCAKVVQIGILFTKSMLKRETFV